MSIQKLKQTERDAGIAWYRGAHGEHVSVLPDIEAGFVMLTVHPFDSELVYNIAISPGIAHALGRELISAGDLAATKGNVSE